MENKIEGNPVASIDDFMENFLKDGYMDNVDMIIREFVKKFKNSQNAVETDNKQPKCECNHYGFYVKEYCIDCHNEKVFPKE